jgi:uncharacterized Fe-S radical SAM superfamily protein PflX
MKAPRIILAGLCFSSSQYKQPLDDPYHFAREQGRPIESLDDYLLVLDLLFQKAKAKGAVCLKTTKAYEMPGQANEAESIFAGLAEEVSPDTYVNIMGQYRPEYKMGQITRDGFQRHEELNRRSEQDEISHAFDAARRAGLWRFDQRWAV